MKTRNSSNIVYGIALALIAFSGGVRLGSFLAHRQHQTLTGARTPPAMPNTLASVENQNQSMSQQISILQGQLMAEKSANRYLRERGK